MKNAKRILGWFIILSILPLFFIIVPPYYSPWYFDAVVTYLAEGLLLGMAFLLDFGASLVYED